MSFSIFGWHKPPEVDFTKATADIDELWEIKTGKKKKHVQKSIMKQMVEDMTHPGKYKGLNFDKIDLNISRKTIKENSYIRLKKEFSEVKKKGVTTQELKEMDQYLRQTSKNLDYLKKSPSLTKSQEPPAKKKGANIHYENRETATLHRDQAQTKYKTALLSEKPEHKLPPQGKETNLVKEKAPKSHEPSKTIPQQKEPAGVFKWWYVIFISSSAFFFSSLSSSFFIKKISRYTLLAFFISASLTCLLNVYFFQKKIFLHTFSKFFYD